VALAVIFIAVFDSMQLVADAFDELKAGQLALSSDE
jgi:hypothetical protein